MLNFIKLYAYARQTGYTRRAAFKLAWDYRSWKRA